MDASALHAQLAAEFADEGITPSRMFGSDAWFLDGRVVGVMQPHQAAFKLGAGTPQLEDALGIPGAELFVPGGERRWKDWVAVPLTEHAHFARLLEDAIAAARA
ncbi:hypothetical protein HQQ81_17770 [Microbacteriaceae bacterium VKM Ac-2854]|nr:hypothetical protein [Microbacteriaceae bacterium VKM Ac-2854]